MITKTTHISIISVFIHTRETIGRQLCGSTNKSSKMERHLSKNEKEMILDVKVA